MPQPYNYNIPVTNPLMEGLRGAQIARQEESQRMALERERQAMAQQQAAVEAKKQQQAQFQQDLQQYLSKPDKTANDTLAFLSRNPTFAKPFEMISEMADKVEKKNILSQAQNTLFALQGGNVDAAKDIIEQNRRAAINSGDQQKAQSFEIMLKNLDNDPDTVKENLNFLIAKGLGDKEYTNFISKMEDIRSSRAMEPGEIKKQKAEIIKMGIESGLTEKEALKTEAMTKKLGAETQKIIMELEGIKKGGDLSPDKKADLEQKLSDKYYKRSSKFSEVRGSYENLLSSANQNIGKPKEELSGAADLALVTAFMKMLDPGSVVRETEFANARDTAGKYEELKNIYKKWTSGSFLNDRQRRQYTELAKKYMQAAEKEEKQARDQINKTIDAYGLNRQIVLPEKIETPKDATPAETAGPQVFNTLDEAEAASANLPKGARIQVGNEIFEVE